MSKYMHQTNPPPHEGALFPLQFNYSLKKARRGRTARAARPPRDARAPLNSPAAQAAIICTRRRGHNTLQPVAAVGGVFDDGVRLHEVCIDGADKARTVRGEALELLRRIEAVNASQFSKQNSTMASTGRQKQMRSAAGATGDGRG